MVSLSITTVASSRSAASLTPSRLAHTNTCTSISARHATMRAHQPPVAGREKGCLCSFIVAPSEKGQARLIRSPCVRKRLAKQQQQTLELALLRWRLQGHFRKELHRFCVELVLPHVSKECIKVLIASTGEGRE